jgi:hypothetical protein
MSRKATHRLGGKELPTVDQLTMEQKMEITRRWGHTIGYEGRAGGWVYSSFSNRPTAQGWFEVWTRARVRITDWAVANRLISRGA